MFKPSFLQALLNNKVDIRTVEKCIPINIEIKCINIQNDEVEIDVKFISDGVVVSKETQVISLLIDTLILENFFTQVNIEPS